MPFAIAAGIGAVGNIAGSIISSNASSNAAQAQEQAAQNANQTQLAELQASAGLQTPGRNLGYGADSLLAQLFGIPNPNAASTTNMYGANSSLNAIGGLPGTLGSGGTSITGASAGGTGNNTSGAPAAGANGSANYSNFYNTPGYQFALQQGQQSVNRAAAATGGLYSSTTLNQLDQNAQGYASQNYNNYVQQLMGLAGIGGSATASTVGSATTAGNNISANQLSSGNAQASGILGQGSAYSGAINNAGGILSNYSALAGGNNAVSSISSAEQGFQNSLNDSFSNGIPGFSVYCDRRMKEVTTMRDVDDISGLPVYEFSYQDDPSATKFAGYMAQDVMQKYPEAVGVGPRGFLTVDHDLIPSSKAYPERI